MLNHFSLPTCVKHLTSLGLVQRASKDRIMELEAGIATATREVEVLAKADRRGFTAEYKLRILREADACTKPGEIGALLRREGRYCSLLSAWRVARDRGELAGHAPRKPIPKAKVWDGRDKRITELERENRRVQRRAERAEALVEVQETLSRRLGSGLPESDEKS